MNTHYFKNRWGDRGVAFVAWATEFGDIESEKYNTIEDLLNDCGQDYIPSAQRDYRQEVKMLLAAYIREIYKESHMIHEASRVEGSVWKHDGRKHVAAYHENMGRLNAIRDIIEALGMDDAETIGSKAYHYYEDERTSGLPHYYSDDAEELDCICRKLGKDFYKYGFKDGEE